MERQFGRPVLSVALEPRYGKSKQQMFVSGGRAGQLTLSKKGFLGIGAKNVVLSVRDEGSIRAIAWRGRFISWTNDQGERLHVCEPRRSASETKGGAHAALRSREDIRRGGRRGHHAHRTVSSAVCGARRALTAVAQSAWLVAAGLVSLQSVLGVR